MFRFFFAHGNGGVADMNQKELSSIASAGYSTISWESVTAIKTMEDLAQAWADFELVIAWAKANAADHNLDVGNMIIGGRSVVSWPVAAPSSAGPRRLHAPHTPYTPLTTP